MTAWTIQVTGTSDHLRGRPGQVQEWAKKSAFGIRICMLIIYKQSKARILMCMCALPFMTHLNLLVTCDVGTISIITS